MMISNQDQLLLLFRCLGCGVWLGFQWELISMIRQHVKKHRLLLLMTDILGAILSGFLLFVFALAVNGGELRAVMLAAVGAGMLAVHTAVAKPLTWLFHKIKPLLMAVYAFWGSCLRKGTLLSKKFRKKVVFFSKKGLQYIRSWVYNRNN